MNFFNGPLGGHRNYLTHVALPNCFEYLSLQKHHKESSDISIRAKYEEFRLFLNSVESLNNTLEYAFYEIEQTGDHSGFEAFKKNTWGRHPELEELANVANAYKHCVRVKGGKPRADVPSARNLQRPELHIMVKISQDKSVKVDTDYQFEGPLPEHLRIFHKALQFWFKYHNNATSTEFVDLLRQSA
jgi:hypothetical protein